MNRISMIETIMSWPDDEGATDKGGGPRAERERRSMLSYKQLSESLTEKADSLARSVLALQTERDAALAEVERLKGELATMTASRPGSGGSS